MRPEVVTIPIKVIPLIIKMIKKPYFPELRNKVRNETGAKRSTRIYTKNSIPVITERRP
jgi:hypothetical protein